MGKGVSNKPRKNIQFDNDNDITVNDFFKKQKITNNATPRI